MKKLLEYVWPVVGGLAVIVSLYFLYREFEHESVGFADVWTALKAIPPTHYALGAASSLLAYAALAWYDRIALDHLEVRHISWPFISLCSFTTYALSHNIGASVFSGAVVRYRAYSTKGLTAAQVAVLVVLCSYTFGFGNVLLGGLLLTFDPGLIERLSGFLPDVFTHPSAARGIGLACLGGVAVYVVGSLLHFPPFRIRRFEIIYPRPRVMVQQLFAAPLELIGAAAIIYFALPDSANPGYLPVLGTFILSFSAALVSHAPGGLGVFELLFITLTPGASRAEIAAALLVWRLFYLIVPLLMGLVVVVIFERGQLGAAARRKSAESVSASLGDEKAGSA
ncbi:MAG TPA: lysylphosphatidylglycerol synthase domain-containing protein [Methylocystis sp.]|nr:lysylphosphatidylglycerol synthase domain-containing protein [Methylocystis sp.]